MWKRINRTRLLSILTAIAMVFVISNMSSRASAAQAPQPKGGVATVVGVDQPDNCLRIRSGPGNQYDVIGCANMGDKLEITGVWTSNNWAQLADNGWVYGPQIYTDLRPPQTAWSRTPAYVVTEEVVPDYDDWAYLPDYGYDTYWYESIPVFFYNVAVWRWCHPWWWWHGLQAWWWQGGHHGRRNWDPKSFRNFAANRRVNFAGAQRANISALNRMSRTTRSPSIGSFNANRFNANRFNANRSNIRSFNVNRFNANRFNTNRPNIRSFNANRFNANRPNIRSFNANRFNANRSNIRSFNVNRFNANRFNANGFRSGSTNTFRSRSFSSPTRTFSTPNTFRSFSSPRSFSIGNSGVRSFNASPGRGFGGAASMGHGRHR
jgi:hypothetical protein